MNLYHICFYNEYLCTTIHYFLLLITTGIKIDCLQTKKEIEQKQHEQD